MTAGVINIWTWPLTGSAEALADWDSLLSPDERERADRFQRPGLRSEFVVARGRMREILAAACGQSPGSLTFHYGPQGRPTLPDPSSPRFSLSHSGGMAALAICADLQPGLDIELRGTVEPEVARHHFSSAEQKALAGLTGPDWQAAFFRCWTRKEAVVKAVGLGLSMPLADFDVSVAPECPRVLRIAGDRAEAWQLLEFPVPARFACAVAVRSETGGARIGVVQTLAPP